MGGGWHLDRRWREKKVSRNTVWEGKKDKIWEGAVGVN